LVWRNAQPPEVQIGISEYSKNYYSTGSHSKGNIFTAGFRNKRSEDYFLHQNQLDFRMFGKTERKVKLQQNIAQR
jgi:hypothetical protein